MEVKIFNKNINYEVYGEGYPVVICHGWLASIESMTPIINTLKNGFKVYVMDVIGMGKSELPDEPLNTDQFGDFLYEFIKAMKIKEKPILIGHSNGGRMIINAIGRELIEAKKIILIDSAGLKTKHGLKYHYKVATYKMGKFILNILPQTKDIKELKEDLFNKRASADYKNSPEVMRITMKTILAENQEKYLHNIKVPTLLIWGEKDTATPMYMAKKMDELIPDSGLVSYPNAGHFSYIDCMQNCNAVINEFLKEERK